MPYPRIERVKRTFTQLELFHRFYVLNGYMIVAALFAASFISTVVEPKYSITLFAFSTGAVALWGYAWGAWDNLLKTPWCVLTTAASLTLLIGALVTLLNGDSRWLFEEQLICAASLVGLWTAAYGLKQVNW
jgi:hypothetical protein